MRLEAVRGTAPVKCGMKSKLNRQDDAVRLLDFVHINSKKFNAALHVASYKNHAYDLDLSQS